MDGSAGSSSGGDVVSSTSGTEHQGPGPRAAHPELPLPQPPTDDDDVYLIAVTRPVRVQFGRNGTASRTIILVESSLDGDGDGDDDAGADDGGLGLEFGLGAVPVPASGVDMACLPETTAGERGGECAVCLEEYEAGDALRTMPCAHCFHERCIFGWLRLSRLCPLCRFALPAG